MSLWGKTSRVELTGTGSITKDETTITGAITDFTAEVSVGDVVNVLDVDADTFFKVTDVVSATELTVTPASDVTLAGSNIFLTLAPTFVSAEDIGDLYLISTTEAETSVSRDNGIKSPGWVKAVTYLDAQGNTRTKSETLAVFKN